MKFLYVVGLCGWLELKVLLEQKLNARVESILYRTRGHAFLERKVSGRCATSSAAAPAARHGTGENVVCDSGKA